VKENTIAVIIPTYNEADNITLTIENILTLGGNFFILVIDDNSPDGTSLIVRKLKEKYANLDLIVTTRRLGFRNAYQEGFKYAFTKGYDIVIQMDADLSHPYTSIPLMIELLDEYDLIIGSRYIKGARIYDCSLARRLLSWMANIFARLILGLSVKDSTSGFRCIKRSALEKIDFDVISSQGFFFNTEMLMQLFLKKAKIIEYPIDFQGRHRGKSKMSLFIIFESFLKVILFGVKRIFKKCCFQ